MIGNIKFGIEDQKHRFITKNWRKILNKLITVKQKINIHQIINFLYPAKQFSKAIYSIKWVSYSWIQRTLKFPNYIDVCWIEEKVN